MTSSKTIQMNFCSSCGAAVSFRIPEGDNLPRFICDECTMVHYQNPKVVTGCIVHERDKVLLCRRAIEPRLGLWTIPAGFMENGETSNDAAVRETLEEAQAVVATDDLFAVYNIPLVNQVYIIFLAHFEKPGFSPGEESLETNMFTEDEIPWDDLAFKVVRESLTRYFENRRSNDQRPFVDHIIR